MILATLGELSSPPKEKTLRRQKVEYRCKECSEYQPFDEVGHRQEAIIRSKVRQWLVEDREKQFPIHPMPKHFEGLDNNLSYQ